MRGYFLLAPVIQTVPGVLFICKLLFYFTYDSALAIAPRFIHGSI